jgi:hypothetical protein
MGPDERAHEITERWVRIIAAFDWHTGRDRDGMLPEQRRRYEAMRKCGHDIAAAIDLIEAERNVGG